MKPVSTRNWFSMATVHVQRECIFAFAGGRKASVSSLKTTLTDREAVVAPALGVRDGETVDSRVLLANSPMHSDQDSGGSLSTIGWCRCASFIGISFILNRNSDGTSTMILTSRIGRVRDGILIEIDILVTSLLALRRQSVQDVLIPPLEACWIIAGGFRAVA